MTARYGLATLVAVMLSAPLMAQDVAVSNSYARILPGAKAGAVYLQVQNTGAADDRLIGAATPIAAMAELHTSKADANGMMQMLPLADGLVVPAGGSIQLASGGDHLMLMGIAEAPAEGASFPLTLTFEQAGTVTLDVPVDNSR